MNSLFAAATTLLVMFGGPRIEGTLDELVARNEAECTGEHQGAMCGAIRTELELRLYDDLRVLYRMGEEVDRETLRTAAAANFPHLALLALSWMEAQPVEGDDVAIIAALENPSAGVRSAALALLGDRLPPAVRALGDWVLTVPYSQDDDLVPDAVPDAYLLGFAPYPGARLVRLASGRKRAFYTTPDPPAKVIATIGKGKAILNADEFYQRVSEAIVPPDLEALEVEMEKMLSETDPAKLEAMQAGLEKLMQPQSKELDLLSEFGPVMSRRSDARVVIVREEPAATPDTPPRATRAAAIFRDDALRVTVIFVPLP